MIKNILKYAGFQDVFYFVPDEGRYAAAGRYDDFFCRHKGGRILPLKPGVGRNTSGIIKYPF